MQFDDSVQPGAAGPDWMRFQGTVLEGGYQLEDMIAADAEFAAFRVRVLGDAWLDVVAHFYACEARAAEEQVAVWQILRQLRHRNLNTPLDSGQKEWDGRVAAYVVLKRTEERLSGVLEERALRPAEAGEVLTSLSRALAALHEHGLVHGCIAPEHVLGTEDAILLSTECVRREGRAPAIAAAKPKYIAPESEGQNTTPEADIWCLGATLFETLTRKECGAGCREEGARLALPFGRIVQRCLEKEPEIRCKLPEIAGLYSSGSMQPRVEAAQAERPRETRKIETAPPRRVRAAQSLSIRPKRGWVYGAIAVLVAIAVISLASTRHHHAPAVTVTRAGGVMPAKRGQGNTAWPTRTVAPAAARNLRSAVNAPTPQTYGQRATKRTVWRVILYTYDRAQDAEARAQQINEQHPGLKAESFSASGNGGPYLVVAGGQMDRDTAMQLRKQALRMGLPHDAYIQNFRR
ncbi:MAG: protein kinase domain-containing protein [Bryobacteraceae bacterium]